MQQKGEFKLNFLLFESSKLWSIHHIALFLSQNKMSIIKCAVGIWHAKVNHALMVSSDLSKRRGSLLRWNIIWKKKLENLKHFYFDWQAKIYESARASELQKIFFRWNRISFSHPLEALEAFNKNSFKIFDAFQVTRIKQLWNHEKGKKRNINLLST